MEVFSVAGVRLCFRPARRNAGPDFSKIHDEVASGSRCVNYPFLELRRYPGRISRLSSFLVSTAKEGSPKAKWMFVSTLPAASSASLFFLACSVANSTHCHSVCHHPLPLGSVNGDLSPHISTMDHFTVFVSVDRSVFHRPLLAVSSVPLRLFAFSPHSCA